MRSLAASGALLLVTACTHLGSSGYRTGPELAPTQTPVVISATRDPAGAWELGVVEAHGRSSVNTLGEIVSEFSARVASMGGDYGRIDRFDTKHDWEVQTYTYACGTSQAPMTCTGSRQVEVATLTVVGRAFRTSRGTP